MPTPYRQVRNADDSVGKAIRDLYDLVFSLKSEIDNLKAQTLSNTPKAQPTILKTLNEIGFNLVLQAPLQISSGHGTPEGIVQGNPGDMYLNLDGGAATTLYTKSTGSGTFTGWLAN